jgi:hypothetical protein
MTDFSVGTQIPKGFIGIWSGSIATIPTGWALCDGNNGTPNLGDKFVLCTGAFAVGASGGSTQHTHIFSGSGTSGAPSSVTGIFAGADVDVGDSLHTHTVTTSGTTNNNTATLPPYYVLAYIMKL